MDKPHKKLDVWRLSMELARSVYRLTAGYPVEEKFGLISQMRRAAVSIPSKMLYALYQLKKPTAQTR